MFGIILHWAYSNQTSINSCCRKLALVRCNFGASKVFKFGRAETWEARISNFFSDNKEDVPYQVLQAKIAQAKGGLTGVGPGNSSQRNFLPHPYSDFIYSIIIEEYGLLLGGAGLIFLYLLFYGGVSSSSEDARLPLVPF